MTSPQNRHACFARCFQRAFLMPKVVIEGCWGAFWAVLESRLHFGAPVLWPSSSGPPKNDQCLGETCAFHGWPLADALRKKAFFTQPSGTHDPSLQPTSHSSTYPSPPSCLKPVLMQRVSWVGLQLWLGPHSGSVLTKPPKKTLSVL